MTRWPTLVETYVCETLNELLAMATTIMPRASTASRPVRPCGSATSMTARMRNGLTRETRDDAPTRTATNARLQRYGRKRRRMRRIGTRGLLLGVLNNGLHVAQIRVAQISLGSSNRV